MITANEIKTRGVKAIEEALQKREQVGITVRGKMKYVVVPVAYFDELREAEILAAYVAVKKDVEDGNYTIETADEHVERIWQEVKSDNA